MARNRTRRRSRKSAQHLASARKSPPQETRSPTAPLSDAERSVRQRLEHSAREHGVQLLIGVLGSLIAAALIVLVTNAASNGHHRPQLQLAYLQTFSPFSHGHVVAHIAVADSGSTPVYGCSIVYNQVNRWGHPDFVAATGDNPTEFGKTTDFAVPSHGSTQVTGTIDLSDDAVSFWEVWAQCQQPEIVSPSRFVVADAHREDALSYAASRPPCARRCAEHRIGLMTFVATLPTLAIGSGNEPTSGSGRVAHAPFRPVGALVFDTTLGPEVDIYPRPESCNDIENVVNGSLGSTPYISVTELMTGKPNSIPPVNRAVPGETVDYSVGNANVLDGTPRVVFTRIDTHPGGVWHGSVSSVDFGFNGYAFTGTFAGAWCGV